LQSIGAAPRKNLYGKMALRKIEVNFEGMSRPLRTMSALPPKADITAVQTNVRFVPKADI
jgi:hypothetical protein